jgi:cytidylate kinase
MNMNLNLNIPFDAYSSIPVITIDGPSGSGKGTLGRLLAQALEWHFLDSGALYRALAWSMQQANITPADLCRVEEMIDSLFLDFTFLDQGELEIRLNGKEVTSILSTEACGNEASKIGALPAIRALLLKKQRDFRQLPGLVADGRDMGTVIFPDAKLKIFLGASLKARAERRYFQLKRQRINVSLSAIETELQLRDERDQTRSTAPLQCPKEAFLLDTTDMSVSEALESIRPLLEERLGFHDVLFSI